MTRESFAFCLKQVGILELDDNFAYDLLMAQIVEKIWQDHLMIAISDKFRDSFINEI